MYRQCGDEAHLCGGLRAFGDGEQEGRVQVAGLAHPTPAEAAAAQRLFIRHKPERPALTIVSEPAGLKIGGIDPVELADRMS
jgi:hypothetical protein